MQTTSRQTGWGSTRESVSCSFPFAPRHSPVSSRPAALKCSLKRWGCMQCTGARYGRLWNIQYSVDILFWVWVSPLSRKIQSYIYSHERFWICLSNIHHFFSKGLVFSFQVFHFSFPNFIQLKVMDNRIQTWSTHQNGGINCLTAKKLHRFRKTLM